MKTFFYLTVTAVVALMVSAAPRSWADERTDKFKDRVLIMLDVATEKPIRNPTDESLPTGSFKGIQDGVTRAVIVHEGMRLVLVSIALTEQQDTARAARGLENLQILLGLNEDVTEARKALERNDFDDYLGRAALLYASAVLYSSVAESELGELMESPLLGDRDKRAIYASYKKIKLQLAKSFEADFRATIKLNPTVLDQGK